MLKYTIFIAIQLLFFSFCFGQSGIVYNTPPGTVLISKTDTGIDYSYKLEEINLKEANDDILAQPIRNFSDEELAIMEVEQPDHFAYYSVAKNYYNSLSDKVKRTFTTDELWYIYFFDEELKNNLLNY